MHLKMMSKGSLLSLKNRIKNVQRTHLDDVKEMYEIEKEQKKLGEQDNF